jgi:uncharacterized protein YyaL (SSP411 family)
MPVGSGLPSYSFERIWGIAGNLLRSTLASPVLYPRALVERSQERSGGFPIDSDHRPHLTAAIEWLERAQDAHPGGGIARGYSLVRHPYFGRWGWQPSYPETTGYIIPTLYEAARVLERPHLAERAERAARWEIGVQLPGGAVQGGVIGQEVRPAVFNSGQVMFGWLAAFAETRDGRFADAARRAGRFLVATLGDDGHWREANSIYASSDATLYNTRTAWALAEAGARLGEPEFSSAAARNFCAAARLQADNGWLPSCCLTDPHRPLLHTLAYAIRGLLEGGRLLSEAAWVEGAGRAAAALAARVREDGWMAGRFAADWSEAAAWSCLTGEAQMANNWMRLYEITGEARWLEPVPRVLAFLKRTQNRTSSAPGVRGGIKGSAPIGGAYGRYEVVSWGTKFFADALLRHGRVQSRGVPRAPSETHLLA